MEGEEEKESPAKSPTSSDHQNGLPTVTVAAVAPPSPHRNLTLALTIQKPRIANAGGGREDCWSEGATSALIDAWGERYLELSRGNLKQKHWREVADVVTSREVCTKTPKSDIQCKNRIDTLKKKYKIEKAKIASGFSTKWVFFDRIEELLGPTSKKNEGRDDDDKTNPSGPALKFAAVKKARSSRQFQVKEREPGSSGDSSYSFSPMNNVSRKRKQYEKDLVQIGRGRRGKSESPVNELSKAILKFGEVFEKVEMSKLEMGMEMERQRMELTKELELQRMRFFVKTQTKLSKLKHGRRVVVSNGRYSNSD